MQQHPKILKGCKLRIKFNELSNDIIKTYTYEGILSQADSKKRHITLLAYDKGKYKI
jgi:hypothetical protein